MNRYLLRFWVIAAFLALLTAVLIAEEPYVEGNRLTFKLPDLHGRTVNLADSLFADKVLLVTLWGTWCPPCISEIPTFNDLQTRYAEEGFAVVAIAFDRSAEADERNQKLAEFVGKHKIWYLVLDGGLTYEFSDTLPMVKEVEGLPVELLIDRKGRVAACRNGYGYSKDWATQLEEEIKSLLEENP